MIAKRKGVAVRRCLKEAWSKRTSRWTRTGSEAYGAERVCKADGTGRFPITATGFGLGARLMRR